MSARTVETRGPSRTPPKAKVGVEIVEHVGVVQQVLGGQRDSGFVVDGHDPNSTEARRPGS